MDAEHINALATSVIAFVGFIGAGVGFYYNLRQVGTTIQNIIILEMVYFMIVVLFIGWIAQWSKRE